MEVYSPKNDKDFQNTFIDKDEWRERNGVRLRYVHGGFEGTGVRFAFHFPEREAFEGRFYHFVAPIPLGEDFSLQFEGAADRITFALTHGAYFVETNFGVTGGSAPDPAMIYKSSAAAAEYSRIVAREMYGCECVYGYVFGGGGGAYKAISCFENTGAWDGAVPYAVGSPFTIPSTYTARAYARNVLRDKIDVLADYAEPGADFDLRDKLTEAEYAAYDEFTRFGFPPKAWFLKDNLEDGALPDLTPVIRSMDSEYFMDFWAKDGYLGKDAALADDSDYTAVQTYHRHTYPGDDYEGWKQYRAKNYPQRPTLIAPLICAGVAGGLQTGIWRGKMIVCASLMDEAAFAWQADWYRGKVKECFSDKADDHFRLWFTENAMHEDCAVTVDETHAVSYVGVLFQALIDVARWVEMGIAPPLGTNYKVEDGQVTVPSKASERSGVQPTVKLLANGKERAEVKTHENIYFSAEIGVPCGAGEITAVEWSFGGEQDFPVKGEFHRNGRMLAEIVHPFAEAGTFYPTIRIKTERNGDKNAAFTQIINISRARVVVS